MSEHLDLDALADHLVGEGGGDAHLSTCPVCQDRLAELSAAQVTVSASLAALPPPPLPPDLAERIAAAIAAEPGPASSARSATVTPLAGRRPRPRRAWPLSVAAAVVLVCVPVLGYTLLVGGGNDSAEQTAALDSAAAPDPNAALRRSNSGVDYADPAAVPGGVASVLDGTAPREALAATSDSSRGAPPAAPLSSGAGSAEAGDPLDRLRDPAGLASCLLALLPPEDPDVRPLALDYARYGATPALAVVLPDPDPARVAVFVVGPACGPGNEDVLAYVRVARP